MQTVQTQIRLLLKGSWIRVYTVCQTNELFKVRTSKVFEYGRCPKILQTKLPDEITYANSADPEGAVFSGSMLLVFPRKYVMDKMHKKTKKGRTGMVQPIVVWKPLKG